MNILFLTQTFPRSEEDTAGPFIRDLARALVRAGDRITVLAPHAPGLRARWEEEGVRVRTFRYAPQALEVIGYSRSLRSDEHMRTVAALVAPLYLLGARRAVRRARREQRFDLVHAHWIVPNALAAAGATGTIPFAIGLHGSDVFLAEKGLARPLVRRALGRASLLTGCSPELVERVCRLGFPADRSRVIPYGVDPGVFFPAAERGRLWRERLGIPETAPLVLSVGRMATKKGFQVGIEILPRLLAAAPDAHWVFAGAGDRLEEFRALAAPWPERVHFPGGVLRDTLADLYRAADLFVLPAIHDAKGNVDGLPNVILEAMASGLPVVASNISGIPLAIEDERTGLLVREHSADDLLAAIVRLLRDTPLRREMGREGRAKVERELTWDAVGARYRMAYSAAVTASSAPR